jgi:hypothetical protein
MAMVWRSKHRRPASASVSDNQSRDAIRVDISTAKSQERPKMWDHAFVVRYLSRSLPVPSVPADDKSLPTPNEFPLYCIRLLEIYRRPKA